MAIYLNSFKIKFTSVYQLYSIELCLKFKTGEKDKKLKLFKNWMIEQEIYYMNGTLHLVSWKYTTIHNKYLVVPQDMFCSEWVIALIFQRSMHAFVEISVLKQFCLRYLLTILELSKKVSDFPCSSPKIYFVLNRILLQSSTVLCK